MNKVSKISVQGLYKVFGENPAGVLGYVEQGMDKTQLLDEHQHVLGLQDINVDITAGEITVIMGLSGSGKSTLIRHINRLIEPTSGKILMDGENILEYSDNALLKMRQKRMSMVFQNFGLMPHQNVLKNASTARLVRGEEEKNAYREGIKWLNRVGLQGFENHFPHQLSGGMQQRVGIARALASDSDIILMDEAFSALDPLIRTDMQNLLLELQKELQKTIIFITHDLDESLKLADHLVILKDGAVIQQGEPQHILLHPNNPYIVDFISDINRARVLRVRSVMQSPASITAAVRSETVDYDDNLESVIAKSEGDTNKSYRVTKNSDVVGVLHMKDLVRALVPTVASQEGDA
ncbi:MAG: ATP-binding cassette domain-containing protein [Arenicella sp.]